MTQQLQKIVEATGIPRPELLSIWESVKVNHALLEGCRGHDFGSQDERKIGAKYTCRLCGGVADAIAVTWYVRGLAHGSKKV